MKNASTDQVKTLLAILIAASCGAEAPREPRPSVPPSERPFESLERLDYELKLGSTGDDVRALHAYLARYGFLPNGELARQYPSWRPLVSKAPADLSIFDDRTVAAVRQLQIRSGLPQTGVVDEKTRSLFRAWRCGVPEGLTRPDRSSKYAVAGTELGGTVRYGFNTSFNSEQQARTHEAADIWEAETSLVMVASRLNSRNINIERGGVDGCCGGQWAKVTPCCGKEQSTIHMDFEHWYDGLGDVPRGQIDFKTVMLHEFGHALGLDHSSLPSAVMYGLIDDGQKKRFLTIDDKVGISALYDTWSAPLPGQARDIAVGGVEGSVWVIGMDFTIWKWNGSGFVHEQAGGFGKRIAVDHAGIPWVVSTNGSIWRRTSNDPSTGTWEELPGNGCATDIGVGLQAMCGGLPCIGVRSVWVIGCAASPDAGIYRHNGAGWVRDQSHGLGTRIAVNDKGIPWIVNSAGNIYRYSADDPLTGSWGTPLAGTAIDIGVSKDNYVWVIGTNRVSGGWGVHFLNEQPAGPGSPPAPARGEWVQLPSGGGGTNISVGPNGEPWVVNSFNNIHKTDK